MATEIKQQQQNNVAEDVLNPSTFVAPTPSPNPTILIEYCDRCRWQPRATWIMTELLLTFPPPTVQSIVMIPRISDSTAGRFRIWLNYDNHSTNKLLWDRKVEGKFPEAKEIKQRVRDNIAPNLSLGHSDKK